MLGPLLMMGASGAEDSYLFTDDFNRANNTDLGSDWNESGTGNLTVTSNQLVSTTGQGQFAMHTTAMSGADHYAEIDVVTEATFGNYLVIRSSAANTSSGGYYGGKAGSEYQIGKMGVGNIATTSGGSVSGTRMRLQAVGTTISLLIDDVQVLSTTDSTSSGLYVGVYMAGSNGIMDNYEASTV